MRLLFTVISPMKLKNSLIRVGGLYCKWATNPSFAFGSRLEYKYFSDKVC